MNYVKGQLLYYEDEWDVIPVIFDSVVGQRILVSPASDPDDGFFAKASDLSAEAPDHYRPLMNPAPAVPASQESP